MLAQNPKEKKGQKHKYLVARRETPHKFDSQAKINNRSHTTMFNSRSKCDPE